jgi:hypothetical protein
VKVKWTPMNLIYYILGTFTNEKILEQPVFESRVKDCNQKVQTPSFPLERPMLLRAAI